MRTNKDVLCSLIQNMKSPSEIENFMRESKCVEFTRNRQGELLILEKNHPYSLDDWAHNHRKRLKDEFNNLYRRMNFLGQDIPSTLDWRKGVQDYADGNLDIDAYVYWNEEYEHFYWKHEEWDYPDILRWFFKHIYNPVHDNDEVKITSIWYDAQVDNPAESDD